MVFQPDTRLPGQREVRRRSALPASSNRPPFDITIFNAANGSYALRGGFIWCGLGMALATGYFTFVYWMSRGKVQQSSIG